MEKFKSLSLVTRPCIANMVGMMENLLECSGWSMGFTTLMHANKAQLSDVVLQFMQSQWMALSLPTVMHTIRVLVMEEFRALLSLSPTQRNLKNIIVLLFETQSHFEPCEQQVLVWKKNNDWMINSNYKVFSILCANVELYICVKINVCLYSPCLQDS